MYILFITWPKLSLLAFASSCDGSSKDTFELSASLLLFLAHCPNTLRQQAFACTSCYKGSIAQGELVRDIWDAELSSFEYPTGSSGAYSCWRLRGLEGLSHCPVNVLHLVGGSRGSKNSLQHWGLLCLLLHTWLWRRRPCAFIRGCT